jgi:hypothetical protein
MIECPFCGEKDFDLVGLKGHLLNSCEEFEETDTPLQEARRRENDPGSWGEYQHIKGRKL